MSTPLLVAISVIIGALGNIFVKLGTKTLPTTLDIPKIIYNPILMLGVLFMVVSFPLYSMVLGRMNLSIAFPLNFSLTFLIVVAASYLFLKEPLTLVNFLGIICLVIGMWLISAR